MMRKWRMGIFLSSCLWLVLVAPLPVGAQAGCAPCDMTPPCANACATDPGGSVTLPNPDPNPGPPVNPVDPPPVAPPAGDPAPPAGTPAPPAALDPYAGYWTVQCVDVGTAHGAEISCPGSGYAIIWTWNVVNPANGIPVTYPARSRCAAPGECQPVTPTPRPAQTPPPPNIWPCDVPPLFENGTLIQGCDDWPGWDLSAQVCIPGAIIRRYPWPRSLVGLPTKLWYGGAPDLEAFSNKAWPCAVDYSTEYDPGELPECPVPVGQTTEGTKSNYQIGIAWRHWSAADGAVHGFTPEHEIAWAIADREWNGGTAVYADTAFVEHTFETSSYGLEAFGTRWNPECQNRDCTCDERVSGMDMPAYDVTFTTWWYPEYTFRWDEMVCARQEWSACFWRGSAPIGLTYRNCDGDGDGVNDTDYYEIETCAAYKWQNQTAPWEKYDLSRLGYTPVVPWFMATQVGADADGTQCTTTSYGPVGVPVIEVQPVGVPQ